MPARVFHSGWRLDCARGYGQLVTRCMDERRKRVLLFAAAILAARKLAEFDGGGHVPATIYGITNVIGGYWLSNGWQS